MPKHYILSVSKLVLLICALLSLPVLASENHKRSLTQDSDQPTKKIKSSTLQLSASGKYAAISDSDDYNTSAQTATNAPASPTDIYALGLYTTVSDATESTASSSSTINSATNITSSLSAAQDYASSKPAIVSAILDTPNTSGAAIGQPTLSSNEIAGLALSASVVPIAAASGLQVTRPKKDICLINALLEELDPRTPPLVGAVLKEQLKLVTALLSLNDQDPHGRTALMMAILTQQENMARALIKAGANVNIPDCDQVTPLMQAVITRNENLVQLLLDANADATLKDKTGNSALKHAIAKGDAHIVTMLLNRYPQLSISQDSAHLNDFAAKQNLEDVQGMLKRTASACDLNSQKIIELVNCIQAFMPKEATMAISFQEKIKRLLSLGSNVQARSLTLIWAIHAQCIDIIDQLLQDQTNKVDLSVQNFQNNSALHQALIKLQESVLPMINAFQTVNYRPLVEKHLNMVKKLLDAGAPIDDKSMTLAAQSRSPELLKIFIARKSPALVTNILGSLYRDNKGQIKKLTKAAQDCAELLLQHNCDPNSGNNVNLLYHAVQENNLDFARLLLTHNANPNFIYKVMAVRPANLPPQSPSPTVNTTVLEKAVMLGYTEMVKLLREFKTTGSGLFATLNKLIEQKKSLTSHREIAKLLLAQNYNFTVNSEDHTYIARMIAFDSGVEMAKLCLNSQIDPNVRILLPDGENRTLLELSREHNRSELITLLLAKKANPNIKFKKKVASNQVERVENGRPIYKSRLIVTTSLEQAIDTGDTALIDQLLLAGADPKLDHSLCKAVEKNNQSLVQKLLTAVNPNHCTNALRAAIKSRNHPIVQMLLDAKAQLDIVWSDEIGEAESPLECAIKELYRYSEQSINNSIYTIINLLLPIKDSCKSGNPLRAAVRAWKRHYDIQEKNLNLSFLVEHLLKNSAQITTQTLEDATELPACLKILLQYHPSQDQKNAALLEAVRNYDRRVEAITLLLESGADPNMIIRSSRFSLLIYAASRGFIETARVLVAIGKADVNHADKRKNTALLKAIRIKNPAKRLEFVKILLSVPHINVNCVNKLGQTPLSVATALHDGEVIKALKKAGALTPTAPNLTIEIPDHDSHDEADDNPDDQDDNSANRPVSPIAFTSANGKYMAAKK